MDQVAKRASCFFSKFCNPNDTCLIIDEVGFPKKGNKSACVGRQWLGCLGKQDNGQVAVCLTLCNNLLFSIIDTCLFMPQKWADDKDRRTDAGIPADLEFKSKVQIALGLVKEAINQQVQFSWIAFDALYGSCLPFLRELDKMGLTFIGDIKKDMAIYLEKPQVSIPENKGKKGRKFRFPRPNAKEVQVQDYIKSLKDDNWEMVTYRQGTDGPMSFYYHKKQIWLWDEKDRELYSYVLLVRKSLDSKNYKYSFSNARVSTPIERLAYMQGQRFFIEQSFKEGKNQVGMGDYQVRSWEGFHKHMAMVMLALNFLMEEKHRLKKGLPAITTPNIVEIFKGLLPQKEPTVTGIIKNIIAKAIKYELQIKNNRRQKQERKMD